MPLIALDARLTRQMSVGMEAYVRELAARLPAQAPDFDFAVLSNERLEVTRPNARLVRVSSATATNGSLGEQLFFPRLLTKSGAMLVHYMSVYAPRLSPIAHVYTIHDLIHLRFPQYFSWKVPLYYQLVVGPVARSAAAVITDAHATVDDLRSYLGVAREKVRVVPLGVAQTFMLDEETRMYRAAVARERLGLDRPYFIYAGNHRPHKNLQTLVAAWQSVAAPCDLVLTEDGPFGFTLDRGAKSNGRIHLAGHVALDELISLYAGSAAVVQPSLYEGFGLSVLEAMACGAPAIVARTPVLLELGSDAVVSFPPKDERALAAAMTSILLDAALTQRLRAAGRERASAFTWDATARSTAAAYREVLQS